MPMRFSHLLAIAALAATPVFAQSAPDNPLIDYEGYTALTAEVAPVRRARLISLVEFNTRAAKSDVLLLDARSAQAFAEGHIAGAVNLPLPDFTAEALAEVIGPDQTREILIYCNNNFTNNRRPVVTKSVQLALNIQTFINLYGYGYRNVFELGEAIDMNDPKVRWVSATT
jgi:phage shock protein E